jgi:hypothetical protein
MRASINATQEKTEAMIDTTINGVQEKIEASIKAGQEQRGAVASEDCEV